MAQPQILVTAAAGKTGRALVAELRSRGFPVRALVRSNDARGEALARSGAEVVVGDLYDGDQMAEAMRGVQRAYYCPPLAPDTSKTLTAFMHGTAVNRLEAVVAMTQWLASPRHPALLTRDMWTVEQQLPTLQDTVVTILNPGFFADNYLRIGIAMAAQLGLYPNLAGNSRNAPPSNEDMARVATAILADPARHDRRRYRITGPELIGVREITATLSKVLRRRVRAIPTPDWLFNKVAAYGREPRYEMSVVRHYFIDHRQGAFEYGAPTDVVREVTGRPAESFETTVRSYLGRPEAQRTGAAFRKVFSQFMLSPMWRGYDHAAYERQNGVPTIEHPLYAMQDEQWKADRAAQNTTAAASRQPTLNIVRRG